MSDLAKVKRLMAEVRLDTIGVLELPRDGQRSRFGRNTLYKMLRERGYSWSPKFQIWVKQQ
jgi:hypothetical protein